MGCSAMSKHHPPQDFKSPEQLKRSIAEAARLLVEAVHAHIDARGRVSSRDVARIVIDHCFVSCSFIDYPDSEFLDLVEWRRR
jgi:hypothetical protein